MSVSIRQVQVAAITGGGPTQDFTVSGFGTPKAAMFIVTGGTVNGTIAAHARMSIGVTDGTRQRCNAVRFEDNVGTSDTDYITNRGSVIRVIDSSAASLDAEASFASWITDGVRITWDNLPSSAFLVTCILFTGSDLSAHVSGFRSRKTLNAVCEVSRLSGTVTGIGSFAGGKTRITASGTPFAATDEGNIFVFDATGNEYRISDYVDSSNVDVDADATGESSSDTFVFGGPPFQSDMLICMGSRQNSNDSFGSAGSQFLGFVKRAGTIVNVCSSHDSGHGAGSGNPMIFVETDRFVRNYISGADYGNAEVTAFDSTGFDVTTRVIADCHANYLALAFNGAVDFHAWMFDTPTSTGLATDSGPNFKPQFVMYGMSQAASTGSKITTADAGPWGVSAFTADEAHSNAIMDEDAAATINTASVAGNNPVLLPDDDQSTGFTATFDSMAATGPRLNWTAVKGSARKWIGFAIEEFVAPGGNAMPVAMNHYRRRRV